MLARLEALAAELAVRGRRAELMTPPGGLPFLRIAGEPSGPGEQICALPRRDGTWAYWRPDLMPVAGSARQAADIIAGPAVPGRQFPAPVPGAGHDRAGGGRAGRLLARETGMLGPSPDPRRRQAPVIALACVLPSPVLSILPPAGPAACGSLARQAGQQPAAAPAGQGRP
jgi:hypothetical protein